MINKLSIFIIVLISASVSASEAIIDKNWSDRSGTHSLVMVKYKLKGNSGEHLFIKQTTNGKQDWVLNDYVLNCDNDIELDVIDSSIEVRSLSSNEGYIVFFAYKVGCVGGIDPVPIKYFSYKDGVKYALRGEETIQTPNGNYGGEEEPIPGRNLKKHTILYKYMRDRWKDISLRKYYE
ncbi:M949_RS01915 family surface polysaccharide biosynthesis protein [Aeromonas salmonicida]|uniref:M949_RS01915 family surface polysaccharide biosynthesis protein n=1 Tax=Aeromonas salmonicida TaxID=645 RepID=UPI003D194B74